MSNFLAAIVGALVGGGFLLVAQWWQVGAERRAAGRALLLEMLGNAWVMLRVLKMAGRAAAVPANDSKLDLARIQESPFERLQRARLVYGIAPHRRSVWLGGT
jgi:hypothetical protein